MRPAVAVILLLFAACIVVGAFAGLAKGLAE